MECIEHGSETEGKCTWCSKEICTECINDAKGHKLCYICKAKVQDQDGLTEKKNRDYSKNVDPELSNERIAYGKKMIEEKNQGKKSKIKIRNIPDRYK